MNTWPSEAPTRVSTKRSRLRTLLRYAEHHGVWSTLTLLLFEPLQRLRVLRIGGIYRTSTGTGNGPPVNRPGLEGRFLTQAEVLREAQAGRGWFFREAVLRSLVRGERCFAVLVDGAVVNSRWLAPSPLRQFGVELWAPEDTVFEQRVFTEPSARGSGLAGRAQRLAADELRKEGISWTVATIEVVNAASIAAFRKAGAQRVGWLLQIGPDRWQRAWLVRTSSSCPTSQQPAETRRA